MHKPVSRRDFQVIEQVSRVVLDKMLEHCQVLDDMQPLVRFCRNWIYEDFDNLMEQYGVNKDAYTKR